MLLGWRDPFEGFFEVEGFEGEVLLASNVIDDLPYRIRSVLSLVLRQKRFTWRKSGEDLMRRYKTRAPQPGAAAPVPAVRPAPGGVHEAEAAGPAREEGALRNYRVAGSFPRQAHARIWRPAERLGVACPVTERDPRGYVPVPCSSCDAARGHW
jgi:hypothetical protein